MLALMYSKGAPQHNKAACKLDVIKFYDNKIFF